MLEAKCMVGHRFELSAEFDPDPQVIAAMRPCPEMVAKPEYAGLVMECGALVLWRRQRPERKRRFVFKRQQLDLFDNAP